MAASQKLIWLLLDVVNLLMEIPREMIKLQRIKSPGEVLNVHQHGVLLHVQLIADQQQLYELLVQTWTQKEEKIPGTHPP